jgi:signal transduction histidine kinase
VALTLRLHDLRGTRHDAEVAEISEQLARLVGEIAAVSDPIHQRLGLLGMTTASREFCKDLSAQYDVAIHFEDDNVPPDLHSEIALALFRVLQETTVNAVVHSGAREVQVSLRRTATEIRLQVIDRGVGFDPQHHVPSGGVGLVAIRERLKLVSGDIVVESRRGEGTRVEAWVPLLPDA